MELSQPTNLFNVFLNSADSIDIVNESLITGDVNEGDVATLLIKDVSNTTRLFVGMRVEDNGTYIQAGTTIASIDSATQITLSQLTIAGNAGIAVPLTFSGTNASNKTIFNIGTVLAQAPNAQELENAPVCLIKVKYFHIQRTSAQFTTDEVSAVQIRLNNQYPNNIETRPQSSISNTPNVQSSNIIGVLPTGDTSYTYSDFNSNPNDYVAIANPFRGQIQITLTNQNGTTLSNASTQDKKWSMMLCVYIPVQPKIDMLNLPSLNY